MAKLKLKKTADMKKWMTFLFIFGMALFSIEIGHSQTKMTTEPPKQNEGAVSGAVIDSKTGEALIGAEVTFGDRTDLGTVTDIDGKFILEVPDVQNGYLMIRYLGFKIKKVEIKGQKVISIPMEEEVSALEEVIITGFTTQKKGSVIGSLDRISPDKLKMPTRTISTSLAGRLAGVIAVQGSGEPGYDGANFWIRGVNTFTGKATPLVLVDGIERELDNMDPEEISDFTILKDATATAIYGVRGGNGVVLITTKKGSAGVPRINLRVESGISAPIDLPHFADGQTFMRMQNEALRNVGRAPLYTMEQMERTANKYDPNLYPDVNWMDELITNWNPAERVNLNISGGSETVRYFIAASVFNQNGMFKNFDEGMSFNNNIREMRYNFRANVDANITRSTTLSVGLASILEDRNYPGEKTGDIFRYIRITPPTYFPMTFPDQTKTPGFPYSTFRNPYQMLARSGYVTENHTFIQSNFTLNQDLAFITKGLQFKGIFSFDSSSEGQIKRIMKPRPYTISQGDDGGYVYQDMEPNNATYHDYLERELGDTRMDRKTYLETSIIYNRVFGQHTVGGLFLYNQSDKQFPTEKNLYAAVPMRNQGITGRASYSFKDKYYAEFNFGYNGSENFMKGKRYGFFPALAFGWVPTSEAFMDFLKPAIDYMKIRVSHGTVGNDNLYNSSNERLRFVYLTRVEQTDINVGFGTNNGYGYGYGKGINFTYYGDPQAIWEKAMKSDIGLEVNFLKHFSLQFDAFYEKRTNIWAQMARTPDLFGFSIIPYSNVGEMQNKGFDGFLEYTKRTSKDLSFNVKGTFSYAHNKILANGEETKKYAYQSKIGHPHNSLMGYVTDGYFIDDAHVEASPSQRAIGGTDPKAGDVKYKDINGDGVVDEFDRVFMGNPNVPEVAYGLGLGTVYKGFDLSLLFQGADRVSFFAIPKTFEMENRGNIYQFIVGNHWSEENPDPRADFPRLGIGSQTNNYANSDKWLQDGSYIRLKQAELGYSLPEKMVKNWGMGSCRIYTNALNLFTLSSFKWWDAESKNETGAYYPIQRVVNLGVEIKF
jgi:TonB-linked SusC/RagA family outer membrane protein